MQQEEATTPPRNNWNLSKLDYCGMAVCVLLFLGGTGESIFFATILVGLLFGKRLYHSAKRISSKFEIVGIHTENEINEKTKELKLKEGATSSVENIINSSMDLSNKLKLKMDVKKSFIEKKSQYIKSIKNRSTCDPVEVIVLGGAGWENKKDNLFMLSIDASFIYMSDLNTLMDSSINIDDLMEIEISGPGKVTNNAGVTGGGFGAEGALQGIAISTVINTLTSHSNTKTFIRLGFQSSEIVMLTQKIEPDKARIILSSLYIKTNRKLKDVKSNTISDEIKKLYELKQNGVITNLEFENLKKKLIS